MEASFHHLKCDIILRGNLEGMTSFYFSFSFSGLFVLKMLSEYIDTNNSLPALSSEVVLRVVELLKFFNTRTCQLVLGAGAMQVRLVICLVSRA